MLTGPINWDPPPRQLRYFAWLLALALAIAAWRCESSAAALGLRFLAATLFGVGVVWPRLARWVYAPLAAVTYPVGWLLSHALLALVYYGLLTPLALVFRLLGRDALKLRREPEALTYWVSHPRTNDPRRYLHQF